MRRNKRLLLVSALVAILSLGICFLIENVSPFYYSRGEFIQWFFLGFAIIGCGGVMLFFFMLYSASRKELLDEVNVFVVNVLIFLKDFRDNLANREAFDDGLERLKNIADQKKKLLVDKKGFFVPGSYSGIINKFSKYIDEYSDIHNKYVPEILKNKIPADRERLISEAQVLVEGISYRAYKTARRYARRRGSGYKFKDFKAIVGGDEYEKRESDKKRAELEAREAEWAQKHPQQPPKPPKAPKEQKPPKEKAKKGPEVQGPPPPPAFGQQPPQGQTQYQPQGQTQYQPQRPQGMPPQGAPAQGAPPNGVPFGVPPQGQTQYQPQGQTQYQPQRPQGVPPQGTPFGVPPQGQTQYQPQRPQGMPPQGAPFGVPPQGQAQPQRPQGTPPPQAPPVQPVVAKPPGVKPPSEPPKK